MADPSTNSPSFDAAIRRLEACEKAARKMLAVLKTTEAVMPIYMRGTLLDRIREAIEQAEAAGLKGDE